MNLFFLSVYFHLSFSLLFFAVVSLLLPLSHQDAASKPLQLQKLQQLGENQSGRRHLRPEHSPPRVQSLDQSKISSLCFPI